MLIFADVLKESAGRAAVVRVEHELLSTGSESEAHERLAAFYRVILRRLCHLLFEAGERRGILRNDKLMVARILDGATVLRESHATQILLVQVIFFFLA